MFPLIVFSSKDQEEERVSPGFSTLHNHPLLSRDQTRATAPHATVSQAAVSYVKSFSEFPCSRLVLAPLGLFWDTLVSDPQRSCFPNQEELFHLILKGNCMYLQLAQYLFPWPEWIPFSPFIPDSPSCTSQVGPIPMPSCPGQMITSRIVFGKLSRPSCSQGRVRRGESA